MSDPSATPQELSDRALAGDPARAAAELAAIHDMLHRGMLDEAEHGYRRLLRAFPKAPIVLQGLASVLQSRGESAEAEPLLLRALEVAPDNGEIRNAMGALLLGAGRITEAEASFRKAIELAPRYAEAQYNLGVLLEGTGRVDEALAAYRQAARLEPSHARALTRIAAILIARSDYSEALALLERAVAAAPDLFDAQYYRGWALSSLNRHDAAIAALDRAAALRPDSFEAAQAKANALRTAGRMDAALAVFWSLIERRPDWAPLHAEINQLAWISGRSDLYLRSFAYARERLGVVPELNFLQAGFKLRTRDFAEAEHLLLEARQLAPERGDIAGLLARALVGQSRFVESYPLFTQAIAAQPEAMIHRQEFGFALLRDGQPGEALKVFEQALVASPFDQLILAGLALTYRETGDSRYARLVDFAKYVRVYDIQAPLGFRDSEAFNQALAKELDGLHTARAEPIDQTLRGGTQTAGQLFFRPPRVIEAVRQRINAAVDDYVAHLDSQPWHPAELRKSARYEYAGSWSCRLASGGYHDNHVHPKGWISSAYYARLPGDMDDPQSRAGWLKFGESNLRLGENDRAEHFVQPLIGRLVLFPSFYWHGTVPFADQGDRLSIAFDVAPASAASAT